MLYLRSFTYNPFSENTFLLTNDSGEAWIVDPGMHGAQEEQHLISILEKEGLKPQAIINTHTHIDHILGVQALKDKYSIPFLMHPDEQPVLAGARGSAMLFGMHLPVAPVADAHLEVGKPLILGDDELEVRLAPGHSPGSVLFYYPAGGWAIGGDVLFAGSIGRTDLPGGNHQQLLDSIQSQVFTLPAETVIHPGHGPATTVGHERHTNPFF